MKTSTIKCRIPILALSLFFQQGYSQDYNDDLSQEGVSFLNYIPWIVPLVLTLLMLSWVLLNLNKNRIPAVSPDAQPGKFRKPLAISNSEISEELETAVLKRLQKFENKKEYLSKNVNLTSLAVLLNTNTKYAANIILRNYGTNGTDYLNDLRIEYTIGRLNSDPKFQSYTQKTISNEAGFGSVLSFNRAFKAKTDLTLTEFIAQLQK
jgi:AraC-like DNA-binding protein